jgi:branched-chain amino acid transport system ATP-binding protein
LIETAFNNTAAAQVARIDSEIRVDEIHAGYGKKEVLRGISLSAAKGEMVAIIGPNGSGKSTLLKVISGFLTPTSGDVWFENERITSLLPHDRVRIGLRYFMQGGRVFPNLTVRENLEMGAIGLPTQERKEKITAVLDLFPNLATLLSRRAGSLSGGERQALALAMLLIMRPRLLLLDEPSAGLSPKVVETILSTVRDLTRIWGITVLLVEQNIQQALSICERAIALVNGRVALETNRPLDWLTSGELEQFFLGYKV